MPHPQRPPCAPLLEAVTSMPRDSDPAAENGSFTSDSFPACQTVPTDEELIEDFNTGERDALEDLFRRYQQSAYGIAYRVLRNDFDAQDAVQNAFMNANKKLKSFKGRSKFKTWLLRIVSNAALDLRRSKLTRVAAEGTYVLDRRTQAKRTPLDELIEQEKALDNTIRGILMSRASPRMRRIYRMRCKELCYRQIAEQLDCCERTVRADIKRLRDLILEELAALGHSVR